jgi:hypothetical protein
MSAVDCTILDVHLPEKLIISSLLVPPVSFDDNKPKYFTVEMLKEMHQAFHNIR